MKNTSRLLATLSVFAAGVMFAATLTTRPTTAATNPSANLDQCANGPSYAPVDCTGLAWQNGNANSGNAHWSEGDSIAYRLQLANIPLNTTHRVTIQWDTTKGGKHALDYITSYNRTVAGDPCSGVGGCGSPSTFAIPADTHTGLNLPPQTPSPSDGRWNQVFTMFNGTITSVVIADPAIPGATVPYNLTGTYAADSSTSITVTFTATTSTSPVLAWGGHIANRKDWGSSNSAVAITGSPFHMRSLGLDGSGGQQDRGLSSSAVVFPAILTITKNVVGSNGSALIGPTPFNFTGTSPAINNVPEVDPSFTLVNDGVTPPAGTLPANQRQFKLFLFGTSAQVTVTEGSTTGFALTGLTCAATLNGVPEPNTNTVNAATGTATIVAAEGQEINCTYVNQQYATLTVIKSVVKTNGGTADAGSFTLRVTSTNGTNLAGPGSASGTVYSLAPGTYTVSEDVPPLSGYTRTGFSGDCDASGLVTLSLAGSKTCTVTNHDVPGTLIVKKLVVNDGGGTKKASDFSFSLDGNATTTVFALDGDNNHGKNTLTKNAGTYTVTEPAAAGYTTTYDNCSNVVLTNGGTQTCTITNDDQTGTLIVRKVVINDNGGTKKASDFGFSLDANATSTVFALDGDNDHGKNTLTKNAGTYTITEPPVVGYDTTYDACSNVVVANGETKTCTITNNDQPAHLIINKVVVNNDGGSLTAAAFSGTLGGTVVATGGNTWSGAATDRTLTAVGSYSVTENAHPGYDATFSAECTGTIALGETRTCTVKNDDQPAYLIINKTVINDNGGFLTAANFSGSVSGVTAAGGQTWTGASTTMTLTTVGSYGVAENDHPGYDASFSSGCTGTVALGETKTCTITNNDQAAHLIINRTVTNDNGGSLTAADFSGTVSGVTAAEGQAWAGASTTWTLTTVGSYSIAENAHPGYDASFSSDCTGTIALGETKTCTITNNDQAASLIINKAVINDNGGSLTADAFSGTVGGVTAAGGQTWTGASTTLTLTSVGSYSVTENAHPGYDATFSADCTGAIALGQTRTCTVTNDDQVPHLIVNKVVVNNNGGSLTAAAFSGTIGGAVVAAGGNTWSGASTDMTLTAVGSYSVAENAHPGYDATFSAGCSGTIALGETRICTVTNDDQAAHLTLIKHVVNGNGGSASAGAFTLTASGAAVPGGSMLVPGTEAPGVTIEVNAGYYIVTENSVSGYTQTGAVGCEGTLTNGGSATCTVVNSDQKSDPGIQTTMSWRLIDSAAFTNFRTGAGQSAADATIVFNLYGPSAAKSCVGQGQGANLIYTETITGVATAGPYPTQTGWVVTVPGTYRWIATYSGDSFNNGKATQCGDETHTITVGEPPATPLAQFITPVNGATDVNATQPIQWTAVDGAQAYYLYVGTSVGAKDLVNTGEVQTTTYSAAGLLPAGQLLYARIWTKESSIWRYSDITFTVGSGGTTLRATVIAPVNGATGVNPAGTIQWTSVPNAQKYYVYVGSTPGALDLIDSQEICNGCVNSPMVTSWSMANAGKSPAQGLGGKAGQTVYLRLWTMVAGVWRFVDSSFTIAP